MLGHLGFKSTKGAGFRFSSWPPLAWIQVFSIGGSNKGGAVGGSGIPPPENFEILSPRKPNFRHFEAKSACFNISFFKVKMPFFLHQNITKLSRNGANLHL